MGVVVDSRFHQASTPESREQHAYEVLLHKFDMLLKSVRVKDSLPNRGLVIHDRRVVVERDIQTWTTQWRKSAGNIGQLRNLADVPLFADSRASRLLQLADLVSYSLYRRYAPGGEAEPSFATIYPRFHHVDGVLHGCVHFTPSYGAGSCDCEPCGARFEAEAVKSAAPAPPSGSEKRTRRRTRAGKPIETDQQSTPQPVETPSPTTSSNTRLSWAGTTVTPSLSLSRRSVTWLRAIAARSRPTTCSNARSARTRSSR
ncbi:DUF3800 domain-containing protein [Aeromicrobium fastidiosum]|uniref:DUF3800 domain-containing protein n=1 Tax=Aeromicrobium fastidiosum TaxID=52699 RepID=A0A641AQV4_9ACTN|nr:DUF3800 domain-containing protein [Aeromicrobium fastidiosum]